MKKMCAWNRNRWIDVIIFGVLFVVYTIIMFRLFYNQTFGNDQFYPSDMKAYILEMQGLNTKYSFPYPIFFKLGALFHIFIQSPELCIALAACVLNSLGLIFLKYYLDKSVTRVAQALAGENSAESLGNWDKKRLYMGLLTSGVSIAMFFVSMLFLPNDMFLPGLRFKYMGVFTPNPYHNATYQVSRPFAIVCFFLFADILGEYEQKSDYKKFTLFGLFLLLLTMTKPSFTFVLVAVAGIIMAWRLIVGRFKNFLPALRLGLFFVPTFCALLYQFFGVFGPVEEGERGIGIGFALVWKEYSGNIVFSILLAMACPLFVLLFHLKDLKKSSLYLFSWQIYLMGLAQVLLLYEKGFRIYDMNFCWGYMYGILFAFIGVLVVLLRDTYEAKVNKWLLSVQWLSFLAHVVMGVWYFKGIFMGNLYY